MEIIKKDPIIVDSEGGHIFGVVGDNYRVLISGKETDGAFATIDMLVPPKSGPGPHSHPHFFESFYVVGGEVEVHSEAGVTVAKKGTFVMIPKGGIVHYFKNVSNNMTHLLCTVVPAGLEEFFEEIGVAAKYGEFLPAPPMDLESIKALQASAGRHGQTVFPPDYLDKK